ncbi:1573_t:CDS:2 [Ambispora leptoticha]|uniref:1573_t:CDS:1 n=1 Tax=Ambispora leptoticha TaxID=144679 RepID=A0A9N8ZE85_9GLOM|nr:1573_t:CDS:2 [Ambispora leptoticha]
MEIFVNTKNICSKLSDDTNSSHSCSIIQAKTVLQPPILHLLPCHIDFEGPAKVNSYFLIEQLVNREIDASKKPDSNETESASLSSPPIANTLCSSFRGRKLIGHEVVLKDGYEGFIFKETSMKPTSSFKESSLLLTTISSVSNSNDENENNNDDHLSDLDRELLELTTCDEETMIRCWETAHEKFDRFTVWGHDELPESWNCPFHEPTPPPIAVPLVKNVDQWNLLFISIWNGVLEIENTNV